MQDLTYLATRLHRQRTQELLEEARIERYLNSRKQRDAIAWQQRRMQRHRHQG